MGLGTENVFSTEQECSRMIVRPLPVLLISTETLKNSAFGNKYRFGKKTHMIHIWLTPMAKEIGGKTKYLKIRILYYINICNEWFSIINDDMIWKINLNIINCYLRGQ